MYVGHHEMYDNGLYDRVYETSRSISIEEAAKFFYEHGYILVWRRRMYDFMSDPVFHNYSVICPEPPFVFRIVQCFLSH